MYPKTVLLAYMYKDPAVHFSLRKRSNTTVENHATSADEPFSSLAYLGKRPRKFRINQKKKKKKKKVQVEQIL